MGQTATRGGGEGSDGAYPCDIVFGPDATQEQVYDQAVDPICDQPAGPNSHGEEPFFERSSQRLARLNYAASGRP